MIISAASQQTFCSAGENQDLFPGSSAARNTTGRDISAGRQRSQQSWLRKYFSHFNAENIFLKIFCKIFDCSDCGVVNRPESPGWPLACDLCVCLYMGTGLGDVIIISACYQTTIRISTLYWDQFSYGTCPSLSHTNVIWSFLHHLGQVWEWNQLSLCNSLSLSLTHFAPLNKIGDDTIEYLGPGPPVTARPARNGW